VAWDRLEFHLRRVYLEGLEYEGIITGAEDAGEAVKSGTAAGQVREVKLAAMPDWWSGPK